MYLNCRMSRSCLWLCTLSLSITLSASQFRNPVLYYDNSGPPSNGVYYKNCAPDVRCNPNAMYRTINGSCNNLLNPLWGSSITPYLRLSEALYADGDHELREETDGTPLPGPREIQLELFLWRSRDYPDVYNYHVNQFGQWSAHDITLMPPDLEGPDNCCAVPMNDNTPYACESVIWIPDDDQVFGKTGHRCMEFRRAMTAAHDFDCMISPQIPMNQATAFIDASQLYGHEESKAAELRTYEGGELTTSIINGEEFCPLLKRDDSFCDKREGVKFCFDGGDSRMNQHFGITIYTTVFTRFHNYVTGWFHRLNPHWSDEKLYQEARRFIGAASQIMIYRDYLPVLLGRSYTKRYGLGIRRRRTMYTPLVMPQLTIEFSGGAFRVPHNILPSRYYRMNRNYGVVGSVKLNEWMSIPDPLVKKPIFDDILRGMTQTPGREPKPSYNYLISNFMFHFFSSGDEDQDLLAIDIQRGRDTGVPTYNMMRQLCGFPRAMSFSDLSDIPASDIKRLQSLYSTVDDVDLIVGALLEPPCPDAQVGPTARCVIADVFYRIRYGDRFFFDVEGQPGSFTVGQLRTLKRIDLGYIFCATTGINEVPIDIYRTSSRYSTMRDCESRLSELNFGPWKTIPNF